VQLGSRDLNARGTRIEQADEVLRRRELPRPIVVT
jgi:hypothetical protein